MAVEASSRFRGICLELARSQHGVVARYQLIECGLPPGTIDRGLRGRFLFRVLHGVYSVGRPELSERGVWMACVLASGPGAALAGLSAAKAWGFEKRHRSPVCVVRPGRDGHRGRARLKAQGHHASVWFEAHRCRWLRPEHITRDQCIPILQIEPALLHLAGRLGEEPFQFMFWEADRIRGLNDRRLDECVEISKGMRGGAAFRIAADCRLPHIAEARSLLEVLIMDLCRREGIPEPLVNRDAEGHTVDFRWPEERVVVETDGHEFHRGHGSFERDTEAANDLRASGLTVLRFTYRMVRYRPDYVKATILEALASPGR